MMNISDEMRRSIITEVHELVVVLADPEAVLAIVKGGPGWNELYCIWGDKYVPDHPAFVAAFSRQTLAALASVDAALAKASPVWDSKREDAIRTPLWHCVESAAQRALLELQREAAQREEHGT
jgi:hypothetical protein